MQPVGSAFLEKYFIQEKLVFSLMFTKTIFFSFRGSHSERIWYFLYYTYEQPGEAVLPVIYHPKYS
jgi:hypothetical protein